MRWSLIGASNVAATHMIPALRAQGQHIEAVMSRDAHHAARFAHQHSIATATTDLGEALDACDAVYISTANVLHARLAGLAADAGRHVLCDKPVGLSPLAAQEAVERAARAGVVLAANHHLRASPVLRALRTALAQGLIGEPVAVRVCHAVELPLHLRGWRLHGARDGGGVVFDITVHDIDAIRYVTGLDPLNIVAVSGAPHWDATAPVTVSTAGLLTGEVPFSTCDAFATPHATTSFEIHGTAGSLVGEGCLTQAPLGTATWLGPHGARALDLDEVPDLYSPAVAAFVAATQGTGVPLATGLDGAAAVATAWAAAASLDSRCLTPVTIFAGHSNGSER